MKWIWTIGMGCVLAGLVAVAAARPGVGSSEGSAVRVGVFDSRAVAVAFTASDLHDAAMAELRAKLEAAKAAGDSGRVRELEAQGPAWQARVHKQGFSTAPVDDILEHVSDALPALAEREGVELIVSKWRVAYRHPDAQLVDVTDALVQLFEPDDKTLRTVREIRDADPLPLYGTDWKSFEKH